jgi:hypothetical protein
MASPTPIIAGLLLIVAISAILIGGVPAVRRLRARRVSSYQSKLLDKWEETTMIYTGVFIPLVLYFLKDERGIEFKVSYATYRSVDIGDTVSVSKYSDGSYRLNV